MHRFTHYLIVSVLLPMRLIGEDRDSVEVSKAPPAAWQIAGIRAAFGDARAPISESASDVQREALKLCAERGWGGALDPKETAVYLTDPERDVRFAALDVLRQIGPGAIGVAGQVVVLLGSFDSEVLRATTKAMAAIDPDGNSYGGLAEPAPSDDQAHEHELSFSSDTGLWFWGSVQTTIPGLPVLEADVANNLRIEALRQTKRLDVKAMARIEEGLRCRTASVRNEAVKTLGDLGNQSSEASAKVAVLLDAQDTRIRTASVEAIGMMNRTRTKYLAKIVSLLDDPDLQVRRSAVWAMRDFGAEARPYASKLAAKLSDPYVEVRGAAVDAFGNIGPVGAPFVVKLAGLLKDESPSIRLRVIYALRNLAENAGSAAAEAADTLHDSQSSARAAAAEALGLMGKRGAAFAENVGALLKDDQAEVRDAAAQALSNMGAEGAKYASEIEALLESGVGPKGELGSALERMRDAPAASKRSSVRKPDLVIFGDGKNAELALNRMRNGEAETGILTRRRLRDRFAGSGIDVWNAVFDELTKGRENRETAFSVLDQRGNAPGDFGLESAMLAAVQAVAPDDLRKMRTHLRLWAGDNTTMQRLVTWLGKPDMDPMPDDGLDPEEMRATLGAFRDLWKFTEQRTELRAELAGRVAEVANVISARPDDTTRQLLTDLAKKLRRTSRFAGAVNALDQALGK